MGFLERLEKNWGLHEQNCFLKDKVVSEWCSFIIIGKWCVVEFVCVLMVIIIMKKKKKKCVEMMVTETESRTWVRSDWSYHTHCGLVC